MLKSHHQHQQNRHHTAEYENPIRLTVERPKADQRPGSNTSIVHLILTHLFRHLPAADLSRGGMVPPNAHDPAAKV